MTGELIISPNIGIRTSGNSYSIIYNDATTKNNYIGAQEATTYIRSGDTNLYHRRNGVADYTIWDSGNDGTGSGLDADLLDGVHYQNILERNQSGSSDSGTADIERPVSSAGSGIYGHYLCLRPAGRRVFEPDDQSRAVGAGRTFGLCW